MSATATLRPPAVAGRFYPADAAALRTALRQHLAAARPPAPALAPKAIVVPHAGYMYSGAVAASAYACLTPLRGRIRRVVLLGPAHRAPVVGLALPDTLAFGTPLGPVPVDADGVAALRGLPQVLQDANAHAAEHSLEVHLPFLQEVLGEFAVLPLVAGRVPTECVAETLERVWGGPETLLVVSSDLSHYHPYAVARHEDRGTAHDLLAMRSDIDHAHACGATVLNGLMHLARRRGMRPTLLDLRNSGDTGGDRSRVVGYAALALHESHGPALAPRLDRGGVLLRIARAAIGHRLGLALTWREGAAFLRERRASFVTLKSAGRLRGCIGSLAPTQSLLDDVKRNARAAAFADPRFAPLTLSEFDDVCLEISLLSETSPIEFDSESHLLAQLRPGIDGLILRHMQHCSTFLPQVWESLPRAQDFLAQLKRKAGLSADFWAPDIAVSRYTVERWAESR